jgi:hypothetical protein
MDIAVTTNFDADQLRRDDSLNIATNILLAIKQQRHPRLRGAQTERNMAKARNTRSKAPNGLGKCAFVDALYVEGKHTVRQILAATLAAFPDAEEGPTMGMIKVRPFYVRKAGKEPKWLKEPKVAEQAAPLASASVAVNEVTTPSGGKFSAYTS